MANTRKGKEGKEKNIWVIHVIHWMYGGNVRAVAFPDHGAVNLFLLYDLFNIKIKC